MCAKATQIRLFSRLLMTIEGTSVITKNEPSLFMPKISGIKRGFILSNPDFRRKQRGQRKLFSLTPNDEPNKRPSSARHHLGLHETGSDDIPFNRTRELQTHSKSCRARKSSRACENGYGSLMPAPTVLSNRTCQTLAPLHIHRGRSHCPNCQNNLVPSSSNESLN